MKKLLPFYALIALLVSILPQFSLQAQNQGNVFSNNREKDNSPPFNPILAPFYHGVASGDPDESSVIIWTRVTPETPDPVFVNWEVATDTGFTSIIQSGAFLTDMDRDYTVKEEVTGLAPGSTYYYRFQALGSYSITGRTKTVPSGNIDQLKFAVVSCNNYQSGYFSAFERISERHDLDAVIHLGDFIYEYESGGFGWNPNIGRDHQPDHEVLTLADYRTRYSYYRLEDELRRVMQQHPFILIWDDHEVANNAWVDGAQNHDPDTEGTYAARKMAATQAYFEWVPIRDDPNSRVFRKQSYGDLMDLILLDTRHEARSMQVDSTTDPLINDPSRTMLGTEQLNWFGDCMINSQATWKIVGNQVLFSPLILAPFEPFFPGATNSFLDTWDGYPARRLEVIDFISQNGIDNVFFMTGDIHVSAAVDVTPTPGDTATYNPLTGMGSVAVEAVTPSITSNNFDEVFGTVAAGLFETLFPGVNTHAKFIDFDRHGYYILDLNAQRAQADYYYVPTVVNATQSENFECGLFTNSGENFFRKSNEPSPPKPVQDIPAPDPTLMITSIFQPDNELLLLRLYPNPFSDFSFINYALGRERNVSIQLFSTDGKLIQKVWEGQQQAGNYTLHINGTKIPPGNYILQFLTESGSVGRVLIKTGN